MSVFNKQQINFKEEPLFFGTGKNIQEYADPKYPVFTKLDEEMESLFWRPSEVSLQKDRTDFKRLNDGERFIFVANLQYQILLDSIQGRGPLLAFLPVITNPELESCVITWGFFEKIHSKSYTYMIRNLFADPSDVLQPIIHIPQILERAKSIGDYYDEFIDVAQKWLMDRSSVTEEELFSKLYMAVMCVNILEGVRFYVSFACNFAFGQNKVMEGSAKIMSLIARDEAKHLALTQHVLKRLQNGSEGEFWKQITIDCAPKVERLFEAAIQQEKDWATYLFQNGSMLGLTENVLHQYIDHISNKRMRAVGSTPFNTNVRNPLGWLDSWLNSRGLQEAPQETEKESYLVGKINADVSDDDFGDLTF